MGQGRSLGSGGMPPRMTQKWPLVSQIRNRSLVRVRQLATRHFEAGQKRDIAPLASSAALADAESLLGCAKLRPAFFQLVFGICFVFRACRGYANHGNCRFFVVVS